MDVVSRCARPGSAALLALFAGPAAAQTADETRIPCTEDAMIVFDASGSMAGNTVQGLFSDITRIDEVRKALGEVLPGITKFRKVGLITYGPGPYGQCNVDLAFPPIPNAADPITSVLSLPAAPECGRPHHERGERPQPGRQDAAHGSGKAGRGGSRLQDREG